MLIHLRMRTPLDLSDSFSNVNLLGKRYVHYKFYLFQSRPLFLNYFEKSGNNINTNLKINNIKIHCSTQANITCKLEALSTLHSRSHNVVIFKYFYHVFFFIKFKISYELR